MSEMLFAPNYIENDIVVNVLEPLNVGGIDGKKLQVTIESDGQTHHLIAKKYVNKDLAQKAINKFNRLDSMGYPVPSVVLYYEINNEPCVLTSDLRYQNGVSVVWGINHKPTDAEHSDLLRIKPTNHELETVLQIGKKFDKDRITANMDVYAIDRPNGLSNNQRGTLGVTILDVDKLHFDCNGSNDSAFQAKKFKKYVLRELSNKT